MTISGYSSAIVDGMLGWLKGLANWVLRLFNLAGSTNGSPLLWLSENWLKLLILLILVGIGVDVLVWLIRWRPYWVWFRKERVIINDDKFFADADLESDDDEWEDGVLAANWDERNYTVTGAQARRQNKPEPARRTVTENGRRRAPQSDLRRPQPAAKQTSGKAKRANPRPQASRPVRPENQRRPVRRDHANDALFDVDTNKPDAFDFYEDEVFNVNNLPFADERDDDNWQR